MDLKQFLKKVEKYPEIVEEGNTYSLPRYEKFMEQVYKDRAINEALSNPEKLSGLRTEQTFLTPELNRAIEEANLAREGSEILAETKGADQRDITNVLAKILSNQLDSSLEQNRKVAETMEEEEELIKRMADKYGKLFGKKVNVRIFPRDEQPRLMGYVDKKDPSTINLSDRILASPVKDNTVFHEVMHTVYPGKTFAEDINQIPPDAKSYAEYLAKVQKDHFINDPVKDKEYKHGSPGMGYELFKKLAEILK